MYTDLPCNNCLRQPVFKITTEEHRRKESSLLCTPKPNYHHTHWSSIKPAGACGYGEFGRRLNGGDVGAVSRLYRDGTGCGACYQARCTKPNLCNEDGVKVVVTDHGAGDNTDFILSARAFAKLAHPNMAKELMAYGVVDIEYRRISCQYPGYNLMFKVHEHSRFPEYLAIVPIYQGGTKDITAVDIWQADCQEWRGMRKAYGGVWDMPNPPTGPMNLRFQVNAEQWLQVNNAIPSEWKTGASYDTAMQFN